MAAFKHHSYFPKERDVQRYLFPFVCFGCRKAFRKPHTASARLCPQCAAPMTMLGRKFHAPRKTDIAQWKKVKYLAEHGFLFQSFYQESALGGMQVVPYPRTLREVPAFVATYSDQAVARNPSAWRTPRTAALGYVK
ncbi:hypothetical protein [Piscinibacterium candidicorallinum]|uniref:hypothetical protein n=1 Tax=Piscinibacterium candidicorallinum TaxID=1793872 RepID=UPI00366EAD61